MLTFHDTRVETQEMYNQRNDLCFFHLNSSLVLSKSFATVSEDDTALFQDVLQVKVWDNNIIVAVVVVVRRFWNFYV